MIKGQVFANQLFENQIFALFINTFTDGKDGVSDNYKNGMAITYSGSDVTIDSGAVLIQGRFLEEDTSTTISAGADNMYCKLVIEIDLDKTNTTTEFNQGYYKIVKSSTTWPTLTQTNIVKNVSGVYQYELARFRTTANGITDFEDRRTFIDFASIYDEIRQHIQDIDDESIFVLKSGSTMTGKLIAEGGVEGNVQGNASSSSACSGNSATASKLATARKITINGAVSGNQNFDGSGNITITTTQNNIAVLTGTLTSAGGYYKQLDYPSGYNKNNCVVISCMIGGTASDDASSQGLVFNGGDASARNVPLKVTLGTGFVGVVARSSYITIGNTGSVISVDNTADLKYKVVLMKIA